MSAGIEGEASVSRAAQRLDYAQSNPTARVKQQRSLRHRSSTTTSAVQLTPAGATLLPRSLVGQPRYTGSLALHALPPATAVIPTVFVRRHDTVRTRAVEVLLDLIRSAADLAQTHQLQRTRLLA